MKLTDWTVEFCPESARKTGETFTGPERQTVRKGGKQ
jgi:hypothetical protein